MPNRKGEHLQRRLSLSRLKLTLLPGKSAKSQSVVYNIKRKEQLRIRSQNQTTRVQIRHKSCIICWMVIVAPFLIWKLELLHTFKENLLLCYKESLIGPVSKVASADHLLLKLARNSCSSQQQQDLWCFEKLACNQLHHQYFALLNATLKEHTLFHISGNKFSCRPGHACLHIIVIFRCSANFNVLISWILLYSFGNNSPPVGKVN